MNNSTTSLKFSENSMSLIDACVFKLGHKITTDNRIGCISSKIIGFTAAYLFPIYGLFGSVTNIINFLVFLVWWPKKTRQTIYLGVLAIADFFMLLTYGWVGLFPSKGLPWASGGKIYYKSFFDSSAACTAHNFLVAVLSCCATSLFLLMVADRAFAVFFPIRAQQLSTKTAWILVTVVTIFSVLSQLPIAFFVRWYVDKGAILCWIHGSENDQAVNIYHSLTGDVGALQTIIIFILNVALIIKINSIISSRKKLTECKRDKTKDKELAATINILILSNIYVVCCLPQVIGYGLAGVMEYTGQGDSVLIPFGWNLGDFGWFMFFLQESINWIVYMIRMPTFRKIMCAKFFFVFQPFTSQSATGYRSS